MAGIPYIGEVEGGWRKRNRERERGLRSSLNCFYRPTSRLHGPHWAPPLRLSTSPPLFSPLLSSTCKEWFAGDGGHVGEGGGGGRALLWLWRDWLEALVVDAGAAAGEASWCVCIEQMSTLVYQMITTKPRKNLCSSCFSCCRCHEMSMSCRNEQWQNKPKTSHMKTNLSVIRCIFKPATNVV